MTSKEALIELIAEAKSLNRDDERLCFFETKLMNELEILEIIKKHYDKNSLFVTMGTALSFWIDKNDPDFEKVKEWLKDDK